VLFLPAWGGDRLTEANVLPKKVKATSSFALGHCGRGYKCPRSCITR
jgi:hypothetical protein